VTEPAASRPPRVVVAEDDPNTLNLLRGILEGDGCEVRAFRDPREALASLRADPADVLVSDWHMEGMDGPDLLKQVRATTSLQGTYCILVTAQDFRGKKVAGLLIGADDYLAKPVSETELLARIRVGLRVRRLERAATLAALAATLGHEVNNPLTGVFGFLDVARAHIQSGNREKALEALARVEEGAERIRAVVARVLAARDPALKGLLPGTAILDTGPPAPPAPPAA
jgi:DNA-binding response OmpR family regulator